MMKINMMPSLPKKRANSRHNEVIQMGSSDIYLARLAFNLALPYLVYQYQR